MTFEEARLRFDQRVDRLNAQVNQMTHGGHLVPVAQCSTACRPGALADFFRLMHLDPFDRYNQFFAAGDDKTADMFDTVRFDPQFIGAVDDAMVRVYQRAQDKWADFKRSEPEADRAAILAKRHEIRAQMVRIGRDVEEQLYPGRKHLWQDLLCPAEAEAA